MFAEATVKNGHVSHGSDASAYVRFYKYLDKGAEQDFVEIRFPGDMRTVMRRKVKDDDKMRWPGHWQAYLNGEQSKATGIPLEQWPGMDEGVIRELNHKNIYTVEQLSAVADGNIANIGIGARALIDRAKAYLELKKDTDAATKYTSQFAALTEENRLLQEQNRDLASRLQALEDAMKDRKTLTLKK